MLPTSNDHRLEFPRRDESEEPSRKLPLFVKSTPNRIDIFFPLSSIFIMGHILSRVRSWALAKIVLEAINGSCSQITHIGMSIVGFWGIVFDFERDQSISQTRAARGEVVRVFHCNAVGVFCLKCFQHSRKMSIVSILIKVFHYLDSQEAYHNDFILLLVIFRYNT